MAWRSDHFILFSRLRLHSGWTDHERIRNGCLQIRPHTHTGQIQAKWCQLQQRRHLDAEQCNVSFLENTLNCIQAVNELFNFPGVGKGQIFSLMSTWYFWRLFVDLFTSMIRTKMELTASSAACATSHPRSTTILSPSKLLAVFSLKIHLLALAWTWCLWTYREGETTGCKVNFN